MSASRTGVRPRRGTLAHISEVRQELEPLAAALRDDATELLHLDLYVHRSMYAATHNPYLDDTLVRYGNLATRIWCLFIDRLSDMAAHNGEHGPLIEAIVDGEADRAADLARGHCRRPRGRSHEEAQWVRARWSSHTPSCSTQS